VIVVLDPKVVLLLATGALLLLNGLIARHAAAKRPATGELSEDGTGPILEGSLSGGESAGVGVVEAPEPRT
jgi:hypothetical protein